MIFPCQVALLRDAFLKAPASIEAEPRISIPKEGLRNED